MAHYLITGGAGFIGSHLVERLLAEDHRVTVLDDLSSGRRENLPETSGLALFVADLLSVRHEQLAGPFDAVVHLAALPSVNDSWTQLAAAHAINLTGTVRVIELAQALGIPRIVYASSAAVYGDATVFPIAETAPLQPLSPYGLQKFASEEYGRLLARENLTFVALRFFNVFGLRQVAGSPYSGVITKFASAMRANEPVTIFGGGGQTRDFVYVQDIVTGLVLALQATGLKPFTVCNLGGGSVVSITQLAEAMRALFPKWEAGFRQAAAPPGDIVRSEADIAVARHLLGYEPRFSLTSGLSEMFSVSDSVRER